MFIHKGVFKCFSSGETGDAISFVQKVENLEFQEALEFISQRFGIPLKYESGNSNSNSFVKSIDPNFIQSMRQQSIGSCNN